MSDNETSPDPKKRSRRDFLRGKFTGEETAGDDNANKKREDDEEIDDGEIIAGANEGIKTWPGNTDYVQIFEHRAMGCDFGFYFNLDQYPEAADAALECFDRVDKLEDIFSVYRDDSQVCRINKAAVDAAAEVEDLVFDVLSASHELTAETGGAFDITAGSLSELWGFHSRQGEKPDEESIREALNSVGLSQWAIDGQRRSVSRLKQEVRLDLGAIGKGFALDRCADLMNELEINDYLLHGGNSSLLARGRRLSESVKVGWMVGITHPVFPDQRIAEIYLCDQALGTSGTRRQGFFHDNVWYGHIIDPRTGYPAKGVFSASVISDSAAVCDALATAFYVMGLDESQRFCEQHPEIGAIMVTPTSGNQFEVNAFNLSPDCWRLI